MATLSDDFYDNLTKPKVVAPTTPSPQAPTPSAPMNPGAFQDLTPEQQTQKFGGEVGSNEYLISQGDKGASSFIGGELAKTFGIKLPGQYEWDKMSTPNKISTTIGATGNAAVDLVKGLPKAIVRDVGSVLLTAAKPFYNLATGKKSDAVSLANEPVANVPWLGDVPTMYQSQKIAEDAGMGPVASRIFAGSNMILQTTTAMPFAEILSNTFRPRGAFTEAGVPHNTAPIQKMVNDQGVNITKTPSTSEYYSLRKEDAKQFGGTDKNIQWKMSPNGDDAANISLVKSMPGAKVGSYVKTEFGLKKVEQGDLGPEIKLTTTEMKSSGESIPSNDNPVFIIPEARKGLENRPITMDQVTTLGKIGSQKGLEAPLRDAIIKTITGKNSIGELTEGEFARVAQTLSKFGEKYNMPDPELGPFGQTLSYVAPQRHYFDYVEDTYGVPLKSQIYDKAERAAQLTKVLDTELQTGLDEMFGKYTDPKHFDDLRLVDAYLRGDQAALLNNTAIDAATKSELVELAGKLKAWDDTHGEMLGLGREAYLDNYGGPKISDLGGSMPQYKDLSKNPSKEFFAKFKRKGSLDPFIDNPYISRQIYVKEGTKALHFKPILQDFDELSKVIPSQYARQANSYLQEKLGKLGGMERVIDSFVPKLNQRLGINLPPDAARQMSSWLLTSMYSGLVGTPKAVFQQLFQLPTFVYARLGTEFAGEALIKSMSKAERARVDKLGYLNKISQPYGEELAGMTPATKFGRAAKTAIQSTIKPQTWVDNDIRIKTFLQAEMQWNNALNKYNKGELEWAGLESKLDFGAFSKTDQNTIRQALIRGDKDAAFNTYMREILDETSFPYRTGAGAKIGYGMAGKLATGLLNYTIESTNVLSRWARTGQWDKLIRFAGGAKATSDTLAEQFGFDFSDTLSQKPLGYISPVLQLTGDFYDATMAWISDNKEEFNKNADNIARTLKNSQPAGVVRANASKFWKSYKAGADESGQYPLYDSYGKMIGSGDFTELFWGTLMGFPTVAKKAEQELHQDINNYKTNKAEIQNEINSLLREGKYDEMEKLIEKTGIMPTNSAMQQSYIPRIQRDYQGLDPLGKAKFAPRVFAE